MLSRWLESIGQDPRTFGRDVVFFIIHFIIGVYVMFAPLYLLAYAFKPYLQSYTKTAKPPQLLIIFVPYGIYLFFAITMLFSVAGGWYKLSRRFRAPLGYKATELFRWQSGGVGATNYNNALRVGVAAEGLYVACIFPFSLMHPPLLIPWAEIKVIRQKRILIRQLTLVTIGSPKLATLTLEKPKVAEAVKEWLTQSQTAPLSDKSGAAHG